MKRLPFIFVLIIFLGLTALYIWAWILEPLTMFIITTVCILAIWLIIRTAPEGFEDEKGFYYGEKK